MKNFNINLNFSLGILTRVLAFYSPVHLYVSLIPNKTEFLLLSGIISSPSQASVIEYHWAFICVKIFSWCVFNYCPWWISKHSLRFLFFMNKLTSHLSSVMPMVLFWLPSNPEPSPDKWGALAEFWCGLYVLIHKNS